ncbi:MAG: transporter substrate-binding domain-containing protein [Ardenticatenaceae bacterium]
MTLRKFSLGLCVLLAILAIWGMSVGLSGRLVASSAFESQSESQSESALAPVVASTATPSSPRSVIERIRERDNTLLAGVKYDFKPFGFVGEGREVVGFDVDLVEAMADEWGVEVEFVQVTSSNRIPKLVAGEVDMLAASMTHNKERDEQIDFSQTYFLDGQSLLVREDSGIEGVKDLHGKTVAAIAGSTSIKQIKKQAEENSVSIGLLPFQEYPPALAAVEAGQIDALTTDSVALRKFAQDNPELSVVGGLFTKEPYGMGLPSGDSYFHALVNFTLQKLKEDGTYDEIYHKWFGDEARPYEIEILPGEWRYTFATSPTSLDKPEESAVERILEEGRFVAGVKVDSPPFGVLDEKNEKNQKNQQNEPVGFDIDIMKEFAERWLGDEKAVEFVPVSSSNRIEKLVAGEVDILAASMTHTKARDEKIDFSQTYFLDGQQLLVPQGAAINEVADLDGKTVAAIQGSTSIDNIQAQADELGMTIEILPFLEYPQALQAVKAGQVDALTTDGSILQSFAQDNPNLLVVGEPFSNEPYGLGIPHHDHEFMALVNFTLQEMKADGTYDQIYETWFGELKPYPIEIWPGEPADPQIQEMITSDSLPKKEQPKPSKQYSVMEGETLTRLAVRFYRDATLYHLIHDANRQLIGDNPNLIRVGIKLTIPEKPE